MGDYATVNKKQGTVVLWLKSQYTLNYNNLGNKQYFVNSQIENISHFSFPNGSEIKVINKIEVELCGNLQPNKGCGYLMSDVSFVVELSEICMTQFGWKGEHTTMS